MRPPRVSRQVCPWIGLRSALAWGFLLAGLFPCATAEAQTLAPPTVTPATSTYANVVTVNMNSFQAGATVRYTLDGTEPTASSTAYSGPFTVSTSTTVKAKAFHPSFTTSGTTTRTYTLRVCYAVVWPLQELPPTPFTEPFTATITCVTTGASIYYTLDGSVPTQSSTLYTGPLAISTRTVLRAKAFRSGFEPANWDGGADYYFNYGTLTAPAVEPAAGTYSDAVTVNMSSTQPGAQIRYTTDGSDPTDQSTLYTAPFGVSANVTVKAKAFHVDWTSSGTTTHAYELAVATPTISPAAGTYSSAQSVTISTITAGATIRYSLDGSTPTESHPAYSAPITVNTATTVTARAFKAGYSPSATGSALYEFNYGTLADPVISPPGGSYTGPQTVTVSAGADEEIHYTLDGSAPALASPTYTAPLSIAASATLRVRAFRTGWTPSATVVQTYTITPDTVAPTIQASVSPAPNNAGWNRSPVTVFFTCLDNGTVASCSEAVTVSTSGANQVVSGTVTDAAGHKATTSVTLNLDLTPPALALTAPTDEYEVATATVAIAGTVSDALSGIDVVYCGGEPGVVTNGVISCTAPLAKGKNAIVLQVSDVAGNSASATVDVFRLEPATSIRIVPSTFSLLVLEKRELQVIDDFGRVVEEAVLTVSDPLVAEFDEERPHQIHALTPGTVTLTATSGALTAEATVHVVVAHTPTTAVWTTPALIGAGFEWQRWTVYPQHGGPDDPDLYLVEYADGFTTLRGMKADGRELSVHSLAGGSPLGMVGDAHGGVVLHLGGSSFDVSESIARVGPGGTWRYRGIGFMSSLLVDGRDSAYVVESKHDWFSPYPDPTSFLIVASALVKFDIANGDVARFEFPHYRSTHVGPGHCSRSIRVGSALHSPASLDAEGNVRILLTHGEQWGPAVVTPCGWTFTPGTTDLTLSLMTVTLAGEASLQPLMQSTLQMGMEEQFWPNVVVANATGAAAYDTDGYYANGEWHDGLAQAIQFTDAPGGATTITLPTNTGPEVMVGRDNTAYTANGVGIARFDAATGALIWQSALPEGYHYIRNVRDDGGVVLWDGWSTLKVLDQNGAMTLVPTLTFDMPRYWGAGVWHGNVNGMFSAVQMEAFGESTFAFAGQQTQPHTPKMVHFYPIDLAIPPGPTVTAEQGAQVVRDATPPGRVLHKFYIKAGQVIPQNFINEVANAENDAVAFIGHAVMEDPGGAYGLQMAEDVNDPLGLYTSLITSIGANGIPTGPGIATTITKLATKIKIAFVGACKLGDRFKSFWDITNNASEDRVLITSPSAGTRLNVANVAWSRMITALDDGCTVREAIAYANDQIVQLTQTGQLAPHPTANEPEAWEKTGNDLIRLRFQRKGICPGPVPQQ